jgi:U3 small nucleolar RNA-associated protein 13
MANKQPLKTTFDVSQVLRPIFTGGSVAIDNKGRILATTLGEDVVLSDPATGNQLGQISGVSEPGHVHGILTDSNFLGWRTHFNIDM